MVPPDDDDPEYEEAARAARIKYERKRPTAWNTVLAKLDSTFNPLFEEESMEDAGAFIPGEGRPKKERLKKAVGVVKKALKKRAYLWKIKYVNGRPVKVPAKFHTPVLPERAAKGRKPSKKRKPEMDSDIYYKRTLAPFEKMMDKFDNDVLRVLHEYEYHSKRQARNFKSRMKKGLITPGEATDAINQVNLIQIKADAVRRTHQYIKDRMTSDTVRSLMSIMDDEGETHEIYGYLKFQATAPDGSDLHTYMARKEYIFTGTKDTGSIGMEVQNEDGSGLHAVEFIMRDAIVYIKKILDSRNDPWIRGVLLAHKYAMLELGDMIIDRYKERLKRGEGYEHSNRLFTPPAIATGELYNSLHKHYDDQTNTLLVYSTSKHFPFVEYGARIRAKEPSTEMLRAIYDWAVAKGLIHLRSDVGEYFKTVVPAMQDYLKTMELLGARTGTTLTQKVGKKVYVIKHPNYDAKDEMTREERKLNKKWRDFANKYNLKDADPFQYKWDVPRTTEFIKKTKMKPYVRVKAPTRAKETWAPIVKFGKNSGGFERMDVATASRFYDTINTTERGRSMVYGIAKKVLLKYSNPMVYTQRRFLDLAYMDIMMDSELVMEVFTKNFEKMGVFVERMPDMSFRRPNMRDIQYARVQANLIFDNLSKKADSYRERMDAIRIATTTPDVEKVINEIIELSKAK